MINNYRSSIIKNSNSSNNGKDSSYRSKSNIECDNAGSNQEKSRARRIVAHLRALIALALAMCMAAGGTCYASYGRTAETEAASVIETESDPFSDDPYAQAVNEWLIKTGETISENISDAVALGKEQKKQQQEELRRQFQSVYDLLSLIKEDTPWKIRVNQGTCTVTIYRVVDVERNLNSSQESANDEKAADYSSGLVTDSDVSDEMSDAGIMYETEQVLIPVYACPCSVGANNATPNGTFSIQDHLRWHELIGPTWGQWCCHFAPSYLFHSLPYERPQDPYSLQTDVYNYIGEAASHGCVRLTAIDAKYIYDHVPIGGEVEIFEGSEEDDPLGKPERPNVGSWEHSYDPTDPELPENR